MLALHWQSYGFIREPVIDYYIDIVVAFRIFVYIGDRSNFILVKVLVPRGTSDGSQVQRGNEDGE